MTRNIYVGDAYSRKVVTPLISTDCNSYKIVWDAKTSGGVFKITAVRDDGSSVFDFGELTDGVATYVMKSDMYEVEGKLTLYLAICDEEAVVTCREISFTVKKGAEESKMAEESTNPINSLGMQIAKTKTETNEKIYNLEYTGMSNAYILEDGVDFVSENTIVTKLLKSDYSSYEAIAFPEGITEIRLPDDNRGGDTPLIAHKMIMPQSLKLIGGYSFCNYIRWDENENVIDESVVVKVDEFVLNDGLEIINNYAFAGNIYLKKINIPGTVTKIGRGAFEYSDSLKEIFIPAKVREIGNGNFTVTTFNPDDATVILGFAGSVAEQYAKNENGLKEYANKFLNVGSDYSKEIGDIESALDSIISIQNHLLGVSE